MHKTSHYSEEESEQTSQYLIQMVLVFLEQSTDLNLSVLVAIVS